MSEKLNFASLASLSQANNALATSFLGATQVYFDTIQNLAELNFGAVRQMLEDEAAGYKQLLGSTSVQQAVDIQTGLAHTLLKNGTAYAQAAYELTTTAARELAPVMQSQYVEWQAAVEDGARQTAATLPFGKDLALAAIKQGGALTQSLQQVAAAMPKAAAKSKK